MTRSDARAGGLGPLESEVMGLMWSGGRPLTVRDVVGLLNSTRDEPLAYTTVMTVMSRLADKELLRRRQEGRGYLYEPAVTDPAGAAVRAILRDFGESAVASFVDQARGDPKLLRRLRRLMRDE